MKQRIFVPVEVFSREFDAKLVLACYFHKMNYEVIFGHHWYVNSYAKNYAANGDVFLHMHTMREKGEDWLIDLKTKGVTLVGIEEEGPFDHIDYETLDVERHISDGIDVFDFWLCWGERDYQYLLSKHKNTCLLNIGTPRAGLWNEFGKNYYKEIINSFVNHQYPNVVIATSFWRTFSVTSPQTILNLTESLGESFKMNVKDAYFNNLEMDREENQIRKLRNVITAILDNSNSRITIRPYPMENNKASKTLRKIDKKRISIDRSLCITPILMSAKALIHTGSTTAVEAICLGLPTISISKFNVTVGSQLNEFTSIISSKPRNEKELIDSLGQKTDYSLHNIVNNRSAKLFLGDFLEIIQDNNVALHTENRHKNMIRANKYRHFYNFLTFLKRSEFYQSDIAKRPRIGKRKTLTMYQNAATALGFKEDKIEIIELDRDTYLFS